MLIKSVKIIVLIYLVPGRHRNKIIITIHFLNNSHENMKFCNFPKSIDYRTKTKVLILDGIYIARL